MLVLPNIALRNRHNLKSLAMSIDEKIKHWVRPEIRALSAYHVPDATGLIKLDAMENPYQWPEALVEAWLATLRCAELNRYPDPSSQTIKAQLRSQLDIPAEMDLLLGNGSDELIQMILMAVSGTDRTVLSVEPSFVMYRYIAQFLNMPYVGIPLTDDFALDTPAILAAIEKHQPAVIFLAYPNNPTGNLFSSEAIDQIITASDGLVVIDEAYFSFADATYMTRLAQFDNLLVMRTVSKMGLAGLRLGYLAGAPAWLEELDKVRLPYNINILTQLSAAFALEHVDELNRQTDRQVMFDALTSLSSLQVYPSQANFILFRCATGQADRIFDGLKQNGILIKNLNRPDSPLQNCLRVTVGTPEQNHQFIQTLQSLL